MAKKDIKMGRVIKLFFLIIVGVLLIGYIALYSLSLVMNYKKVGAKPVLWPSTNQHERRMQWVLINKNPEDMFIGSSYRLVEATDLVKFYEENPSHIEKSYGGLEDKYQDNLEKNDTCEYNGKTSKWAFQLKTYNFGMKGEWIFLFCDDLK